MSIAQASAVVTGAAGGIGAAFARRLLEIGADVVVADVDATRLEQVFGDLRAEFGGRVRQRAGEVTTPADIEEVLATAERPVSFYVANAGVLRGHGEQVSASDWSLSWDVNVMAHVHAAQALVPRWRADFDAGLEGGTFVSIASAAGLLTQLGSPTYSVTKHAAVAYAEWLAATHGDAGVQVCCVCPMGVRTAMIDESGKPGRTMVARTVGAAGAVISPLEVVDAALSAVFEERFLALPHPEVAHMHARKAADHDGWIAGMQRFRASLLA